MKPQPILIITPDGKARRAWLPDTGVVRFINPKDRADLMAWESERTRIVLE